MRTALSRLDNFSRSIFKCFGRRPHSPQLSPPQKNDHGSISDVPPPPDQLLTNRTRYLALVSQRRHPALPGGSGDSQLAALYRLYEALVLDDTIALRNEIEIFWYHLWPVSSIPDPDDLACPARYAVLSGIPALLVEAFNERISIGLPRDAPSIMTDEEMEEMANREKEYEEVPSWTKRVQPLSKILSIPYYEDNSKLYLEGKEDERASKPFLEKQILLHHPHIHFI